MTVLPPRSASTLVIMALSAALLSGCSGDSPVDTPDLPRLPSGLPSGLPTNLPSLPPIPTPGG